MTGLSLKRLCPAFPKARLIVSCVRHGLLECAEHKLDARHTRMPIGLFQKPRQRLKTGEIASTGRSM
jgi:hypothetical protein